MVDLAAAGVAPSSLAVDAAFNVYIGSQNSGAVRVVGRDGNINTVAGTTTVGYKGDGGPATQALMNGAQAIAMERASEMRQQGDLSGHDRWQQIHAAICELRQTHH